jgi:LysM repeat protein
VTKLSKAIPFLTGSVSAACLVLATGCSGVAQNKTTKTATQGAIGGAIAGAVIGNNTGSGNAPSGAVVGGAAGAIAGAIVGAVGDAKERNEQDRLAQERAYQQELAKRRAQEAKFRAAIDEELAVAEGFRITDQELAQETAKANELEAQLKMLQEERQAALNKKTQLDSTQNRIAAAQQEIERLSAELAELRGQAAADSPEPFVEHRVEQGESLNTIASRYKVPASKIRDANVGVDFDKLTPGTMLKIPVATVSASASL